MTLDLLHFLSYLPKLNEKWLYFIIHISKLFFIEARERYLEYVVNLRLRLKEIDASIQYYQILLKSSLELVFFDQEPGVSTAATTANTATVSSTAPDTKPIVTATKSTPTTTTSTTQRRPYQRSSNYNRQQVMPRLSVRLYHLNVIKILWYCVKININRLSS